MRSRIFFLKIPLSQNSLYPFNRTRLKPVNETTSEIKLNDPLLPLYFAPTLP